MFHTNVATDHGGLIADNGMVVKRAKKPKKL
jgi:hypothetical protein